MLEGLLSYSPTKSYTELLGEFFSSESYQDFKHYNPISYTLNTNPTLLVDEFTFIFAAVLCLVHALFKGRAYVMLWFCALVAGTVNDIIFMVRLLYFIIYFIIYALYIYICIKGIWNNTQQFELPNLIMKAPFYEWNNGSNAIHLLL